MTTDAVRPLEHPEAVVALARAAHDPVAAWCLFSGGNDSTMLAHRCREHYDGLAWIDTGTAVPGVAEFVAEYAAWLGKPLRVLHAGDAYRQMVMGDLVWWARFITAKDADHCLSIEAFIARDEREHGRASGGGLGQVPHGFPGPGAHGRAYNRLKERQIMALLRESKVGHPRRARVLFLSGIRRAESRRRSKREAISREPGRAAVFACPLIDWSNEEMLAYRREHEIPESSATALLFRSGECNCGAFAAPGEREMLKALYPEWFTRIEALEAEAQAAGVRWCRWGGYDIHGNRRRSLTRAARAAVRIVRGPPARPRQITTATTAGHELRWQSGCAAMRRKGRSRARTRVRLRVRTRIRMRFPATFGRSPVSPCTRGVFSEASLCDISTPGCNSRRSSRASRVLRGLLAGCLPVAAQLSASPSELVAHRLRGLLGRLPVPTTVTSPVAAVPVAHRVVAGRRLLCACSRRSTLGVPCAVLAPAVARRGCGPAYVSPMRRRSPAAARDRLPRKAVRQRVLACNWRPA